MSSSLTWRILRTSPGLLRQSSESLAGRIVYHELGGLALDEVGAGRAEVLWLHGGFPRAFLARSNAASLEWRLGFIRTFLERDIPQLGSGVAAATLYRFWMSSMPAKRAIPWLSESGPWPSGGCWKTSVLCAETRPYRQLP